MTIPKEVANSAYYALGYEDPVKFLRVEKVRNFMTRHVPMSKTMKILDVGCYGSHLLYELHKLGYKHLYGLDIVPEKNQYDFSYEFTKDDIEHKTKFQDNTFDIVVISHVLEHLYDVPAALDEIQRILKKGAYFVLCLPLDLNLFARLRYLFNAPIHSPFGTGTHIKFYKYKKTVEYFKERGFTLEATEFSSFHYGRYDKQFPFLKKIARLSPDNFSSEVVFLFKNNKK